jgi:hypothetical protein
VTDLSGSTITVTSTRKGNKMSARLHRPIISRRTWIGLALTDAAIWVIAEVQHSGGSLRTAFDAVWLASFFGFILLLAVGLVAAFQARPRPTR